MAMAWDQLAANSAGFDPALLNLSFVFLLLGYGTKVGLVPVHAWLPDAHAEGPTPISAVLSGLLLNVALFALLRFKMIMAGNAAVLSPGPMMVTMGLISLVFAGFMIYRRRDIKRMFAYSSIEHMGIITLAFGLGGPLANFAGLLQMAMHSFTKSGIFFGVGYISQLEGTQRIADIRGLTQSQPLLGWLLVVSVVAIAGLPPFGIFTSEFLLVTSTFARAPWLAILLVARPHDCLQRAHALRLHGLAFGETDQAPRAACVASRTHGAASGPGRHRGRLSARASSSPGSVTWRACSGRRVDAQSTVRRSHTRRRPSRLAPRDGGTPTRGVASGRPFARANSICSDCGAMGRRCTARFTSQQRGEFSARPSRFTTAKCPRSRSSMRPHPAWSGRSAIYLASSLWALPDQRRWLDHGRWPEQCAAGRSTAASSAVASPTDFSTLKARVCIRFRWVPCMRGSSSPVISGSRRAARRWSGSRNASVIRTKASRSCCAGSRSIEAARVAARVSGDSTVAYSFVFARAVEAALEFHPPPRAVWLRAVMAELERIANHLGDIGAICNDAAFSMMHAECAILREEVLRACAVAFGHRLMMDRIVPGGVAADLEPAGQAAILSLTRRLRRQFPELIELYDNTASLQDRTVGTGVVSAALATEFAAPGYVGRASGRPFDARTCLPYPPYDRAPIEIVVRPEGDVDARVWVRIREIQNSVGWLEAVLASLPPGPVHRPVITASAAANEGSALVEGFRGDILAYVRMGPGQRIERCHLRDPSWFLWPLLEAAIEGNIVADFPLCNKSFNCSYSGHDM